MNHFKVASESESYVEYLESVALACHPIEILNAILWFMDDVDKYNILEPACRQCDFETYDVCEFEDFKNDCR